MKKSRQRASLLSRRRRSTAKGNDTNLVIENSSISGNRATHNGGGIHTDSGNVTLTGSTVSGNSTTGIFVTV